MPGDQGLTEEERSGVGLFRTGSGLPDLPGCRRNLARRPQDFPHMLQQQFARPPPVEAQGKLIGGQGAGRLYFPLGKSGQARVARWACGARHLCDPGP